MGLFDAICTMVGLIVGSGIFVAPAAVAAVVTDPWHAASVWLGGAGIAVAGGLCYAECATRLPGNGGYFMYYREAFGDSVAKLSGLSGWLMTYPASLAANAWVGGAYLQGLFGWQDVAIPRVAAGLLAVAALMAGAGVVFGSALQRILTAGKLLTIATLVGIGFLAPHATLPAFSFDASGMATSPALWAAAFATVMWTFDGWSDITMLAGEVHNPRRNLFWAVACGVCLAGLCYAALQVAVLALLPAAQARSAGSVLMTAFASTGLPWASRLVSTLAVVCVFGGLHAVLSAAARLGASMAQAGTVARSFGVMHPRFGTPLRSLGLVVLLAWVYLQAHSFAQVVTYFSFAVWLYYGATALAVLRLRRLRVGESQARRAPGGLLPPCVVLLAAAAMTALQVLNDPQRTLIGVCVVLAMATVQRLRARVPNTIRTTTAAP